HGGQLEIGLPGAVRQETLSGPLPAGMRAGVEGRDFRAVLRHEVVIEPGMKILDDRSETVIGIDEESARLAAARLVQHAAHRIAAARPPFRAARNTPVRARADVGSIACVASDAPVAAPRIVTPRLLRRAARLERSPGGDTTQATLRPLRRYHWPKKTPARLCAAVPASTSSSVTVTRRLSRMNHASSR